MVKKELIIVLVVISIFFISACDVYNTLYVKEPETEEEMGVVEISDDDIIIEIGDETWGELEGDEEEVVTEVEEEGIEDITGKIIEEVEISSEEKEEIPEDVDVIIVEETKLVSLVPKAEDPDKDVLSFTFTSPLDENGEWQTDYGDAGEYTITATASDGELTTSKEVLIIVNKKEEAPVLESFKPEETAIEIKETNKIAFNVVVSDLNDDELEYSWKLDGVEIGNKKSIEYATTYEDSGSHTIKATVSDGTLQTEKIWSVTVDNVNRKPSLKEIDDVEAEEIDLVIIELEASDPDGDGLTYKINDERFVQDGNVFTWETTYDDAGEHLITATASDGEDSVSQDFKIIVKNVNRAPVIIDIVQKQ